MLGSNKGCDNMKFVKEKHIMILRGCMLWLNVITVLSMGLFIMITTNNLLNRYSARSFLDNVEAIPLNPYHELGYCIFIMVFISISFGVRNYMQLNDIGIRVSLIIDMVLCIATIYLLDFNYNGLIFFLFAEMIYYLKETKFHMLFMVVAIVGYLLMDYEMLSIYMPLYNIESYFQCYPDNMQQYMYGIMNVIRSLNIILFILFCIYTMSVQRGMIAEVSRLNKELHSTNEQLKEYAGIAENMAQTKERNRLAREIHDTLGHTLTGITTGLDACLTLIDISPEETRKQLQMLARVSREGVKEVRRSVNELRPDSLERLSLEMAIREMINDMSQISNVDIYFETYECDLRFDEDEENTIYRVIQESITNAVRHGQAHKICITLKRENAVLFLEIKDDGKGCDNITAGFGTRHMRERIEMLGGHIEFEGKDGFIVRAKIPIRWGETYD